MREILDELERDGIAYWILDDEGLIVRPEGGGGRVDPAHPFLIWENGVAAYQEYVYCRIGESTLRIWAGDQTRVLARLIRRFAPEKESAPTGKEALMMRVLNAGYESAAGELASAGIDPNAERCVIVVEPFGDPIPVLRTLGELFADTDDIVLPLSAGRVAVVKSMADTSYQDMIELCGAIIESVQSETGRKLAIGVGESRGKLSAIAESFHEAESAVEIGISGGLREPILQYRRLLIERFLLDTPKLLRERYYQLFSRRYARLLTSEMMETIDTFFAYNLNLSEAARRLFIHRNTLVYRLDKFQNATGLDLRVFDDASALKVLRLMGEFDLPNGKGKREE